VANLFRILSTKFYHNQPSFTEDDKNIFAFIFRDMVCATDFQEKV